MPAGRWLSASGKMVYTARHPRPPAVHLLASRQAHRPTHRPIHPLTHSPTRPSTHQPTCWMSCSPGCSSAARLARCAVSAPRVWQEQVPGWLSWRRWKEVVEGGGGRRVQEQAARGGGRRMRQEAVEGGGAARCQVQACLQGRMIPGVQPRRARSQQATLGGQVEPRLASPPSRR